MQKQVTIRRSATNGYNHQGIIQLEAQQLITQIQEIIHLTSQKMKQQLQTFQYNQLVTFKQDLFKTQDQFIKVRQQRNQEQIRKKVLNQKNITQSKFQVQMKKSLQMNTKYDQLKIMLKKMNQDQKELKLQISYMNKKLASIKKQGTALDQQFQQLKNQSAPKTQLSRFQKQTNIFRELVNNCQNQRSKKAKVDSNLSQKQQLRCSKMQLIQKLQKSTQVRLRNRISNLKDYIQNIPLQLNFIQQKLKFSMNYPFLSSQTQQKQNFNQQKLPIIQNKIKKSLKTNKRKENYLEYILKRDQVKMYLYNLLFVE